MGADGPSLLALDDLRVAFTHRGRQTLALDGVTLSLRPAEILGVVGESGAGKSLVAAAVIGLLPERASIVGGRVTFEGRRLDGLSDRDLEGVRGRRIGSVFQDPLTSLNPVHTIGRQLEETIRVHTAAGAAEARHKAVGLLRAVGIPSPEARLRAYPHEFSGGMRQRVVIALALAADPVLVIADEPTTALDVSTQAQVMALFQALCRDRGVAALLITHDIGLIAENADRVAVMYAGRVVETGPVAEVVTAPRHPYTAGLMRSVPPLARRLGRLVQIDGAMPRPGSVGRGCAFRPRCGRALARCADERPELTLHAAGAVACWNPGAAA